MNKCKTANTNILVENEKTLQDEQAIANTFIDYFTDVTHSLGLKKKNVGLENTLSKIVKNFRNSESVKKIKESQQAGENSSFSFILISEETYLQINLLFPNRILKQHAQIYSKKLADIFNESIKMIKFIDILKKAEVKNGMNDKHNYRPVSTLSSLQNLFTLKLMHI